MGGVMGDDDPGLVLDASVLIDYQGVGLEVLADIAEALGPAIVLSTTLELVDGLGAKRCRAIGLQIEEPNADELQAAAPRQGGLALDDRLCIEVALRRGLVVVTNDRKMKSTTEARGGPCIWGLSLLVRLVECERMSDRQARKLLRKIGENNPGFIGKPLIEKVEHKLDAMKEE